MKKFYALRLIRSFFAVATVVICLFTISGVGALTIPAMTQGKGIDWIQALLLLISGALIALLSFTISEIIDAVVRSYATSARVLRQTRKGNELNSQILDLMTVQLEVLAVEYGIDKDVKLTKVMAQIAQRRKRLEQEED